VTVHPFIEAEKRDGHNVKRACELLQVSRAAFYARRSGRPGPRAVRDAELGEKIAEVHQNSRGTYGAPRIPAVLQRQGEDCGRRRIARQMRNAGLQGRYRRRRQVTTIPDRRPPSGPTSSRGTSLPPRTASTPAGAVTSPTFPPKRAGSIWPPSSTSPRAAWSAGPRPTTCGPNWSPTLSGPPAAGVVPPGR